MIFIYHSYDSSVNIFSQLSLFYDNAIISTFAFLHNKESIIPSRLEHDFYIYDMKLLSCGRRNVYDGICKEEIET